MVSAACARAMAVGARTVTGASYGREHDRGRRAGPLGGPPGRDGLRRRRRTRRHDRAPARAHWRGPGRGPGSRRATLACSSALPTGLPRICPEEETARPGSVGAPQGRRPERSAVMVLFRRVLGDVLRRRADAPGPDPARGVRDRPGQPGLHLRDRARSEGSLLRAALLALRRPRHPLSDVLREVSDAVAVEEARLARSAPRRCPSAGAAPATWSPPPPDPGLWANGRKTAGAQAHPLPKHLPIRYQLLWTFRRRRRVRVAAACSAALTSRAPKGSPCAPATLHGHVVLDPAPRS